MGYGPQEGNLLSLAFLSVLASIQQSKDCDTFHHASCGVPQKLAARLQGTVDSNVMFGSHEKVAGLGWMVRGLLRDIVPARVVGVVPVASERFPQHWVQRLLNTSTMRAP